MKTLNLFLFLMVFAFSVTLLAQDENTQKGIKINSFPFYIYKENYSHLNHFFPTGLYNDYGDIRLRQDVNINPSSPKTCIQIRYTAEKKQGVGTASIYWQYPAGNWGNMDEGFDLTGAKKVAFSAKGEKGGEVIDFSIGGMAGQVSSDTVFASTTPIELTKEWKNYEIDLRGMDLSFIICGFCITMQKVDNPNGCAFYVSDIYYTDKAPSSYSLKANDPSSKKESN